MRQKKLFRGLKSKKISGTSWSGKNDPWPLPRWGGGTPPPHPHPLDAFGASILGAYGASILGAFGASMLGAFGASILAPSALGVPVLFHFQFEPWDPAGGSAPRPPL